MATFSKNVHHRVDNGKSRDGGATYLCGVTNTYNIYMNRHLLKRTALAAFLLFAAACALFAKPERFMNSNELPLRQRALALAALHEAKGDTAALATTLRHALTEGVAVSELKEALSQLYAYTGFPRSLNGLGVLQRVVASLQTEGVTLTPGKEASPLPSSYNALEQGTKVQTQLRGGKAFNYDFAPQTDYYLKAHLFGDIFARDVLSYADRELVTIAALSGLSGAEPQLLSHVGGSLHMGVTADMLRSLASLISTEGGESEGYRLRKAVAQVLGDEFTEGKPVENRIFPIGDLNTGFAKYFTGNSYLAALNTEGLPLINVTFEPRCRNNWHIHHRSAQILVCVGGEGWYQAWGEPARRLKPGDVVYIAPEVKHWHGAAASCWFQHIALAVAAEGSSNEWLEPVSDEEYNKLPQ